MMILAAAVALALVSGASGASGGDSTGLPPDAGFGLGSDGNAMQPPRQDSNASSDGELPACFQSPLNEQVIALILQYAMHGQIAKRLSIPGLKAIYQKYQRGFDNDPLVRVTGAGAVEANGSYYRVEPGSTPPRSWLMQYTCPIHATKKWVEVTKGRRWYEKSPTGPYIAYSRFSAWSCRGGLGPNGGRNAYDRYYYHNTPRKATKWEKRFLDHRDEARSADTDIPSEVGWQIAPNGPGSKFPVPKVEVFDS